MLLGVESDGKIIAGGRIIDKASLLKPTLDREIDNAKGMRVERTKIKVIIRAHRDAKMGQVQEVMQACRDVGLEDFTFRVKERPRRSSGGRFG